MKEIIVNDAALRTAAQEGMEAFVAVFVSTLRNAIGGELTAETMGQLNSDQITLLAWDTLRQEVSEGGFVQLIHNGYGPFIFKNPFAKALNKMWNMRELSKMIYDAHTLYNQYGAEIEKDCTDDDFMALYEKYPEFDDMDDTFVENDEKWTAMVAAYIDDHLERFATIA